MITWFADRERVGIHLAYISRFSRWPRLASPAVPQHCERINKSLIVLSLMPSPILRITIADMVWSKRWNIGPYMIDHWPWMICLPNPTWLGPRRKLGRGDGGGGKGGPLPWFPILAHHFRLESNIICRRLTNEGRDAIMSQPRICTSFLWWKMSIWYYLSGINTRSVLSYRNFKMPLCFDEANEYL